ncbi:MAG TPA: sulfotransferase [Bacillales bacterium]|nr:sulfotransferase [Bacillales bacterium]
MAVSLLKKLFAADRGSLLEGSKAVTVLGSGRCGTSMAARAIQFVGVDLGSRFIKENHTNPKGFWENKVIVDVHKQIKKTLGPRPFPEKWEKKAEIRPFKKQLKNSLQEQFAGQPIWGWKDPRTVESLAIWKDLLNELGVHAYYLIMVRNPADVAASYKEAYERKEDSAMHQWYMRTLLSLVGTTGQKRVLVDYDEMLDNSLETLRRITTALDLPWPENERSLKAELDDFIDPNLQHNRTTLEELEQKPDVHEDVKTLYRLCLEGVHSQSYLESKAFSEEIRRLYDKVENPRF